MELLHTVILAFHVVGACIILGSIFASMIILINEKISNDNLVYLKLLWKFVTLAIGIQILTGIYLASSEWNEFGRSPIFWTKISLLAIDGFFGGKVLGDRIRKAEVEKNNFVKITNSKNLILFSFLIFLIISTLGVFLVEGGS